MSSAVAVLRDAPADELVEHRAQLVDLVGFLDGDLADEHAAVLLEAHEPGLLERAKRLAHRAARDAEQLGDRRFVELGAGGQVAGEDHALELALHERRQRARLQQRDRGGRRGALASPRAAGARARACAGAWPLPDFSMLRLDVGSV